MTKHFTHTDQLRCPACGSHATQPFSSAYAKSTRSSSSGYDSISGFGEALAPPPEKDEKRLPSLVVCAVAGIGLFTLPDLFDELPIRALRGMTVFSLPVLLASCVFGWVAGLLLAIPAISYNVNVHPGLLATWEAGMICNRCSHRWQRRLPGSDETEGLPRGTQ